MYSQRVLESRTTGYAVGERERSAQGCIHSVFRKVNLHGSRSLGDKEKG